MAGRCCCAQYKTIPSFSRERVCNLHRSARAERILDWFVGLHDSVADDILAHAEF